MESQVVFSRLRASAPLECLLASLDSPNSETQVRSKPQAGLLRSRDQLLEVLDAVP